MSAAKKVTVGAAILAVVYIAAAWLTRTHDQAFTEQGLLTADSRQLHGTVVTPHLETGLSREQNLLWCGSFQLAWNEACSAIGEPLRFDNQPAMADSLNKATFSKRDLDPKSYVAVAAFVRDDPHGQIAAQLAEKFQGQAAPQHLPSKDLAPRPQDLIAYSYLFKNLEFPTPFERIDQPITFDRERVMCFGIGEEYKTGHLEMLKQLVILDYKHEDDFVIELETNSTLDRVILAKIQPADNLAQTIERVLQRTSNSEPTVASLGDVLKIPKLNFDITCRYGELEGRHLLSANPTVAKDLLLLAALQNTRFQLDEQGVRLKSESHIVFGCGGPPPAPPTRHTMVFDKPFLLMLQMNGAETPYFALWVGNSELLIKVVA
jgi:hypothetical protein